VYLSGYLGSRGGAFDTATNRVRLFRMGQAEGVVAHGDRVWWGVYPGAYVYETPAGGAADEKAALNEVYHIGEEQDRPFGVAASADWLAFGTIPNYGTLGGALTLLDRRTGKWQTHRNVVKDQSVIALTLRGDRAYGSTSVTGGLGLDPSESEARVFAWDIKAGKKIADAPVRLPGRPAPKLIGGLAFGPDGLLWGVAAGSVFALDPETLAIRRQRTLYPDVPQYSRFRPQFVGFGPDGLLYSNLAGRVTAIDPATLEFRNLVAEANVMTLGPDGHVYYAAPDEPMRLRRIKTR
ncbi:MAG TPA: hypothetical protein VM490_23725, partial [Armatimonadaceae bacterium]|nr:hypothetical protein [Armatimonadaceae bacterium]